jgi:hypothetical protein
MKTLYRLIVLYTGAVLTGCAMNTDQPTIDTTHKTHVSSANIPHKAKLKNPLSISFYQKGSAIKRPYKIIGTESVSKFNMVGIKRQEAIIQDNMRKIAAAMGGDAVIDIKRHKKMVTGTIVSYENKPTYEG